MAYQIRLFLLAVQFFTRVPITGRLAEWVGFTPQMLRDSAAYFPLVGACVGLVAGGVMLGGIAIFGPAGYGPLIASSLSLIASLLLTGAFHEDGLADVADGLGGSLQRDRALEIMKDSRLGTFGSAALFCALMLKIVLVAELSALDEPDADWALLALVVCAHSLSRAASLSLVSWLDHVGDAAGSKSKPLADHLSPGTMAAAFFGAFVASVGVLMNFDALFFVSFCGVCAVSIVVIGRWFRARLGGFTGDCLGAAQQVCELAIYLTAAALLA